MSFSRVIFNRKKLLNNLESLPAEKICAMVKANAYGLGLKWVCKNLKNRVGFFGVATLEEALEIRKFDRETPVLIVGFCQDFFVASKHNISVTVENFEQFDWLTKHQKTSIKIHIKINSGMNRFGIKNKKIIKKIKNKLKNNKKIIFEGIFTHFFCTNNKNISNKQLEIFEDFLKILGSDFSPIIHIGGGGVFDVFPKKNFANLMVRVGYKLYDGVVKIESQILKITKIKKGEFLGYSGQFVAKKNMRVALVPLGYADGINRKLFGQGMVKICGHWQQIVGNVCMDAFFVDVSNIKCAPGNKVVVFENAQPWATICQTIPYEILTGLNFSRMKKFEIK